RVEALLPEQFFAHDLAVSKANLDAVEVVGPAEVAKPDRGVRDGLDPEEGVDLVVPPKAAHHGLDLVERHAVVDGPVGVLEPEHGRGSRAEHDERSHEKERSHESDRALNARSHEGPSLRCRWSPMARRRCEIESTRSASR